MAVQRMHQGVQQRLYNELLVFVADQEMHDELTALKQQAEGGAYLSDAAQSLIQEVDSLRSKRTHRSGSIVEIAKRFVEKDDEYNDLGAAIKYLSQMRGTAREEVRSIIASATASPAPEAPVPSALAVYADLSTDQASPTPAEFGEYGALFGLKPFEVEHLYWEGFAITQQRQGRKQETPSPEPTAEAAPIVLVDAVQSCPAETVAEPASGANPEREPADMVAAAPGGTAETGCETDRPERQEDSAPLAAAAADPQSAEHIAPPIVYAAVVNKVRRDRLIVTLPTEPRQSAILSVHRFAGMHRYIPEGMFAADEVLSVRIVSPRERRRMCQVAPADPEILNRRLVEAAGSNRVALTGATGAETSAASDAPAAPSTPIILSSAPAADLPPTQPSAPVAPAESRTVPQLRHRTEVERLVDKVMEQYNEVPNEPLRLAPSRRQSIDWQGKPGNRGMYFTDQTEAEVRRALDGSMRTAMILLEQALTMPDLTSAAQMASDAALLLAARCARYDKWQRRQKSGQGGAASSECAAAEGRDI